MLYTGSSKKNYQLESNPIAHGGECYIYKIIEKKDEKVAKIYRDLKATSELENKILYMVAAPLKSSNLKQVAWPLDVLYDENNKFSGFVMQRLKINKKLNDIYESTHYPYKFSVVVAENLCTIIHQVHQNNITIGDFNHGNVVVDEATGIVSMIDCDSFYIGNGKYPCYVCMDGYAAPELLEYMRNKNITRYAEAPFSQNTDLFSLAIHIFRLLMGGVSPFCGRTSSEEDDDICLVGNWSIERGYYVFRQELYPAHPACPPKYVLPDQLIELFDKAFLNDYDVNKPQFSRPKALEWYNALQEYRSSLIQCQKKDTHQYFNELSCCPWCEAEERDAIFNRTRSMNGLPAYKVRRL